MELDNDWFRACPSDSTVAQAQTSGKKVILWIFTVAFVPAVSKHIQQPFSTHTRCTLWQPVHAVQLADSCWGWGGVISSGHNLFHLESHQPALHWGTLLFSLHLGNGEGPLTMESVWPAASWETHPFTLQVVAYHIHGDLDSHYR